MAIIEITLTNANGDGTGHDAVPRVVRQYRWIFRAGLLVRRSSTSSWSSQTDDVKLPEPWQGL